MVDLGRSNYDVEVIARSVGTSIKLEACNTDYLGLIIENYLGRRLVMLPQQWSKKGKV